MKTRKILVVIAVLAMVAVLFAACADQAEVTWTIAIEGADESEFSSVDYSKLSTVTIEVVKVNKEGTQTPQTWEGVLLKDVVEAIGVGEYTSLTIEASDGYSKEYTPDIVNDETTILGCVVDGETLSEEDGYVQTVAGSQKSSMWIKMLGKITVNN